MTAALCLPQQTSLVDRRRSCQIGHGGFLPLRALRSEPIGLNTWNALESSDRSESVRAIRCGWLRSACSTTFAGATAEFSPACASSLVVGENFACGRGRHGNVQRLQTLGAQLGFEVRALTLRSESDPAGALHCSSTEARRLIQAGDVKRAALLLGRPHGLVDQVTADPPGSPRSGRAELPAHLCAPSVGAYLGLVRNQRRDARWIHAMLEVHETRTTKRRSVRYVADDTVCAHSGDLVSERFLAGTAVPTPHPVAA